MQWCASNRPFVHRNGQGTCDALLCASHTLQNASEREQEGRMLQIDFCAALIGSTIRNSRKAQLDLWVLEVLCCLC